jgi:hypothetical protein
MPGRRLAGLLIVALGEQDSWVGIGAILPVQDSAVK